MTHSHQKRQCAFCGTEWVEEGFEGGPCRCGQTFFWPEPIKKVNGWVVGSPPEVSEPRDENAFLNQFRKTNPDWKE